MTILTHNEARPSLTNRVMCFAIGTGCFAARMFVKIFIAWAHLVPLIFFWTAVIAALAVFSGDYSLNPIELILEAKPQAVRSVITHLFLTVSFASLLIATYRVYVQSIAEAPLQGSKQMDDIAIGNTPKPE